MIFKINLCTIYNYNYINIFRENNYAMNICFTLLSCVWSYNGMTKRIRSEDSMGAGVSSNEYPNVEVQHYSGVIIK